MSDAIYEPFPVQREFHELTVHEALLGGAAGPGKSKALMMDPFDQIAVEHERARRGEIQRSVGWAIHFRREFPRLSQTIARSHIVFPQIDPGAKWEAQAHTWTFSSGYKFQFAHMAGETDYGQYQSNEFSHIAFDELTEFTEEQYRFLCTRLRSADPVLQKMLRVRAATNPVGEHVLWVRAYFVDPAPQGRTILRKRVRLESGQLIERDRIYIPATLRDNLAPGFRETYEAELQDKPPHIREALLNANWYVVADAFYAEEFRRDLHVVKPFPVPRGWHRFRSMDWGYKSPCVILYWAVDPDDVIYCYREITVRKMDAGKVAAMLREIDEADGYWDPGRDCSRITGPADNQIRETRGTVGPSMDESFRHAGIFWQMATKNRRASVEEFRRRLNAEAIKFFDTCKNCLRTIPAIPTDKVDAEIPLDGGEDHWLDAVHYAVMSRPYVPDSDDLPKKDYEDELAERRHEKGLQAQRGRRGVRWGYGR